jgi:hypothetical protein
MTMFFGAAQASAQAPAIAVDLSTVVPTLL